MNLGAPASCRRVQATPRLAGRDAGAPRDGSWVSCCDVVRANLPKAIQSSKHHRGHEAAFGVVTADPMIVRVGDEHFIPEKTQPVRFVQLGLQGVPVRGAWFAGADEGSEFACWRVELSDFVIVSVGHVNLAAMKGDPEAVLQARLGVPAV